jgi:hypothetical protein
MVLSEAEFKMDAFFAGSLRSLTDEVEVVFEVVFEVVLLLVWVGDCR